jgi:hypothetical protein
MAQTFMLGSSKQLEGLVRELVVAYPGACSEPDAHGRFPLDEAIAWGASLSIISLILMAYPEALYQRDSSGWLPLERNALLDGGDKEKVEQILLRGRQAYEDCRREAMLQFQLAIHTTGKLDVVESTLALSDVLEQASAKGPLMYRDNGKPHGEAYIPHMTRILSDVYARNKILADALLSVSAPGLIPQDTAQRAIEGVSRQRMDDLEDENVDLKRRLHQHELVFHDFGFDASGIHLSLNHSAREQAMSMMSMDPEPPTVLTKYLETKVSELAEENDNLESENEDQRLQIEGLQQRILKLEKGKQRAKEFVAEEVPAGPSEQEKYLSQRVSELEKKLLEVNREKVSLNEKLADIDTKAEDFCAQNEDDFVSPLAQKKLDPRREIGRKSSHSLEDQLKIIDRISAHGNSEKSVPAKTIRASNSEAKVKKRVSLGGAVEGN